VVVSASIIMNIMVQIKIEVDIPGIRESMRISERSKEKY
jgi:hypothetical protein